MKTLHLLAFSALAALAGLGAAAQPFPSPDFQNVTIHGTLNGGIMTISPYQFTLIGTQSFSTAQLATSNALTIPSGTLRIDFYPECGSAGKDGVCVRFNPGGVADASASPPVGASVQLYLGESASLLSSAQVILDGSAVGPTGTTPALTAVYSK